MGREPVTSSVVGECISHSMADGNPNNDVCDVDQVADVEPTDLGKASADVLMREQREDPTLTGCWKLAKLNKNGFHIDNGLLFHVESMFGRKIEQLCVPVNRRIFTLKTAHEVLGGHMAEKKTRQRIKLSGLFWPTLKANTKKFCSECHSCQTKAHVTCYDRVPIKAIPRVDETFSHWFMDAWGPMFPKQKVEYNYGLLLIDSATRWPVAYPLKNVIAKAVCNCLCKLA